MRVEHYGPYNQLLLLTIVYSTCRGLLTERELVRLRSDLERDDGIVQHSYSMSDGHGRNSRMCLWNHPGNDITGTLEEISH